SNRGASRIIAVDTNPARSQLASRFGASVALDAHTPADQIRDQILTITNGRGADILLDFSGVPDAIELGFPLLRFGGRMILAGSVLPSRPIQLAAEQIVRRLIQIAGVYNYQPEDLGTALDFLSRNVDCFPFHELIGPIFSLDQIQAAMNFAESSRPPR